MRAASVGLTALFNSRVPLVYADLYEFIMQSGATYYVTSSDRPIVLNSHTYIVGPVLHRSQTKVAVGIQVDTLTVNMSADNTQANVNGVPLMQFIASGGLDGARLRLLRAFMPNLTTPPVDSLAIFSGRISDVNVNRYEATLTVSSDLELLDVALPRTVYQPGCSNSLYDSTCGKDRAAYTVSSTVSAAPAPTKSVFDSPLGQAGGHFDLGVVTFTSGINNGQSRTVRSFQSGGLITTIAPFPFAPAVGDAFTIYPGCNKTMGMCSSKFSNLPRFRGFPFVPVAETMV